MSQSQVSKLKVGSSGQVLKFTNDLMAGKLMAMGVLPGSQLEVVQIAPLGSGFYIKVDGKRIALRTTEADHIIIEQ